MFTKLGLMSPLSLQKCIFSVGSTWTTWFGNALQELCSQLNWWKSVMSIDFPMQLWKNDQILCSLEFPISCCCWWSLHESQYPKNLFFWSGYCWSSSWRVTWSSASNGSSYRGFGEAEDSCCRCWQVQWPYHHNIIIYVGVHLHRCLIKCLATIPSHWHMYDVSLVYFYFYFYTWLILLCAVLDWE